MEYVTDLNETFRLLSKCSGEPVYTTIGTDNEGNDVAVPMFKIGAADEKDGKERNGTTEAEKLREHIIDMASRIRSEKRLRQIYTVAHRAFINDRLEALNERKD